MYSELLERYKNQISLYQLYVKNLPLNIHQHEVVSFFDRFVNVKSVKMFNSRAKQLPCASVRFYDFQSMLKVYLKFGQQKPRGKQMCVQISRSTLQICRKCSKVGHWKNQCKQPSKIHHQKDKYYGRNYRNKKINKSFNRMSPSHNRSFFRTDKDNKNVSCFYQRQGKYTFQIQKSPEQSVEYFCAELETVQQQKPEVSYLDRNNKSFYQEKKNLKQQEQDNETNYEEQNDTFRRIQEELQFVSINFEKSNQNIVSQQQNNKLESLWKNGWFEQAQNQMGPFVKIHKTLINDFCL